MIEKPICLYVHSNRGLSVKILFFFMKWHPAEFAVSTNVNYLKPSIPEKIK